MRGPWALRIVSGRRARTCSSVASNRSWRTMAVQGLRTLPKSSADSAYSACGNSATSSTGRGMNPPKESDANSVPVFVGN